MTILSLYWKYPYAERWSWYWDRAHVLWIIALWYCHMSGNLYYLTIQFKVLLAYNLIQTKHFCKKNAFKNGVCKLNIFVKKCH